LDTRALQAPPGVLYDGAALTFQIDPREEQMVAALKQGDDRAFAGDELALADGGRITGQRARATIASQLYNAKEPRPFLSRRRGWAIAHPRQLSTMRGMRGSRLPL
jgi:hypothetical protein